jgi:hypothetical protein
VRYTSIGNEAVTVAALQPPYAYRRGRSGTVCEVHRAGVATFFYKETLRHPPDHLLQAQQLHS